MSLLVWNVRGLNKSVGRKDVKNHIKNLSPSIVALLETKLKENHSAKVLACIPKGWAFSNNYTHNAGGRIWVCWNQAVWKFDEVDKCSQHVTLTAKNTGCFTGIISFVYGDNW